MFSAVEMILTKVSKNREKKRRQANDGDDHAGSSDTGTARRRRRQEKQKRYSSSEESSGEEGNSSESSSEESYSSENSDSSSRVKQRRELRKAARDKKKKKSDRRNERKQSTASTKSSASKSGRGRKMSGTVDRKSRNDEGLEREPEARMSRRYKSEELLNVSDEEAPKLTQSSRAISSLSLKEDQDRKVKQKQIFMELKRKQEKERKDQLAEQRRLKQQKEQQEIMDKISQTKGTEEINRKQVTEYKQTQSQATSQQFAQREELPPKSKNTQEKQWKESSLDSESSEGFGKKRLPVVPPKPRKKQSNNQSSDSLNDFSSRENLVDNIGSLQRGNESIQRPPQSSGSLQIDRNKGIQSRHPTDQGRFSNTAIRSDKLSSVAGFGVSRESSGATAVSQTRGAIHFSSMPRTQQKGLSVVYPRPYKGPQISGGTVRNTVDMGYQIDQVKRNSGVVYQVPNHGPAVYPYNGDVRASPTPSSATIGDFRRDEVSRTINYGHLAQHRSDLV